ncbi:TonB-dependent receptor [Allostella sp. ATCC 35155]|nr:TonB-dependent receptor [Stella sp. ATCC 35155]
MTRNLSRGRRRQGMTAAAIVVSTALGLPAMPTALGQPTAAPLEAGAPRPFAIPPLPLADALARFGRQTGIPVSARGDLVRGLNSPGAVGTMAPEAALARLLDGTGLTFRRAADGTLLIAPQPPAAGPVTVLEAVRIQGRSPGDPHAGAADRARSIEIDRADLERRNPSSLKGVFAGEASVSVGGAQPMAQKVYVQGVEETNLAVTIDGTRQTNKIFHHSTTNLIDPSLLKRVRVDPGVAPADAGPGALAGAIAYETVSAGDLLAPGRTIGGFATAGFSSNGRTFTKGGALYARENGFEGLGYVQLGNGSDYRDGNGDKVSGTGADIGAFLGKAAYESGGGHRFEVSGEQVQDEAFRRFRPNIGRLTNRTEGERLYDMKRQNLAFNYSMPGASGLWDPKIVLGYGRTRLRVPEPYGSAAESASLSGKAQNTFHLSPGNTVTVGVDFYDDKVRYKDIEVRLRETATNIGAFAQARLTPVENLRLSFGLRGDQQWFKGVDGTEIDQAGISGNASAAYDVFRIVTLKAGYSRVFGGIPLGESFVFNPNWNYRLGMKAVESENLTAGFEVNHAGFTFGAGVFRSDFENARNESYGGGPHLTSDFRTQGYNLFAGYRWASGFVRLTFTDTDFEVAGKAGDSDAGQYLGTPIGQIFALEAAHRFQSIGLAVGGTLDAALEYDEFADQGLRKLDGYAVASLYAEYQPPAAEFVTLRAEVNNLFDATYADRATYGQEFANVVPLYEPGRSFVVRAKVTF